MIKYFFCSIFWMLQMKNNDNLLKYFSTHWNTYDMTKSFFPPIRKNSKNDLLSKMRSIDFSVLRINSFGAFFEDQVSGGWKTVFFYLFSSYFYLIVQYFKNCKRSTQFFSLFRAAYRLRTKWLDYNQNLGN